ncbi:MAG: inosose dehydratase [Solirubrobacteraceae bacterium]|nr:inosose dehydratase [Solirubrobacteraceae bacterium]
MSPIRVANAPLSYGAFEMTVGTGFAVPAPERVLEAIAGAGYDGTDLGPPGYLGEDGTLAARLAANALDVVGGFVPMRFSERERWEEDLTALHHTLDLFTAAGARAALPVLCDAGGPERVANPGRGGEDPSLGLGEARWRTLAEGVTRAAETARERGFEPVFHHHTSTYVEGVPEIERLLADTDVALLLDTGHMTVAGGDAIAALTDYAPRIGAIHVKDVRLGVLDGVKAEHADTLTAWRRGLFCGLGVGDVDLEGFCAALGATGYEGWVVVEQDRVLEDVGAFADAAAEQVRNRQWLREHAGW